MPGAHTTITLSDSCRPLELEERLLYFSPIPVASEWHGSLPDVYLAGDKPNFRTVFSNISWLGYIHSFISH